MTPDYPTRYELTQRFDDLKDLLTVRFDSVDDAMREMKDRATVVEGRVGKTEKDLVRIKALWTGGVFALSAVTTVLLKLLL